MANYDLTDAEKATLIEQRLKQFNSEKFQHQLNKETAVALNNQEAVAATDQAIADIDAAITVHEDALSNLSN